MRILKLILFVIVLCLLSSIGYGQGTKVNFGGTLPTQTAWAARFLQIDSAIKLLKYATSDSNKVLGFDASGNGVLRTKGNGGGGGSGTVTSITFLPPLTGGTISTNGTVDIPASSALVDGYLDNADFLAFSQKQNQVSLTTTGTSGAATFNPSTGDLNIPIYAGQTYLAGIGIGLTGNTFYLDTTVAATQSDIAGFGTGSVTNVSTGFGMLGGPITTVGTVRVDSFAIATRLRLQKVADSIAALDAGGTVTSVATGFGLTGGPVTTTGTISVDTTNIPTQYRVDTASVNVRNFVYAQGYGIGTVTSAGLSSPWGLTVGGTNPVTTTGTITATVDSFLLATRARLQKVGDSVAAIALSGAFVPYTGATANVDLGAYGITAQSVTLNGQASPTHSAGKLVYDTDNESLTFYNNDNMVALQVGQEDWIRVRNVSGSSITNGSAVYINGSSSGLPTVALAQANAEATTRCVGLATETIANNAIGYVTSLGLVRGLNTSAFSVGAIFLSAATPGALTQTAPSAPNFRFRVGFVTSVDVSAGTIHVAPSTALLGNGASGDVLITNNSGIQEFTKVLPSDISINGVNIGRGLASVTSNTRVGEGALANNSVSGGGVNGTRNTALGDGALAANTTGSTNTGVGSAALEDVTTGTGNTAVGDRALGVSTGVGITGNTAVGLLSQGSATGSSNTTMGWQSATAGTFSASFVTAIGALSGQALTSGAANTFVGYNSGNAVTTGTSNILYGPNAGSLITTGSFNVLVGSYTGNSGGLDSRTTSNRIVWSDGQTNIRGVCFSTGNWVLGGVTDNATDKLQVVGSLSFTSAPTGTASQADISWNGSTGQATSWQPLNTITASGNQTFSVPALFVLDVISFSPAGNETIRVGTTNGGQELMADQAFTGGTITTVSINQRLSRSGATTIYINGSSGSTTYDISIKK